MILYSTINYNNNPGNDFSKRHHYSIIRMNTNNIKVTADELVFTSPRAVGPPSSSRQAPAALGVIKTSSSAVN